jgi:Trk K+ transport system NAD-binding subunit
MRSALLGQPLRTLREGRQLSILSHRRHNREACLFPAEETILQENDRVTILAQSFVVGQLHALNTPPAAGAPRP